MEQIPLFILSASAIWFVGRKEEWKRWGYIIGLCSQPFWLYSSWTTNSWGIFCLSLFYTYAWGQGIYNYWLKNKKKT